MTVKLSLEKMHKKFLNKLCEEIPLNLRYNSKYNEKQILGPIVYASVDNAFLESLNTELRNRPNSDTIFYHLKSLGWNQILELFQNMIRKNHLELRRIYRLIGPVKVAIDFHDIPYYGKDKGAFVVRGKRKDGTNKFYRIISIDIVERGKRFTMAVIPMNTLKSNKKAVEDIVNELKGIVKISCILMDRGFESVEVYKTLFRMKKRWVTPVKKSRKIVRLMDECAKADIWKTVYRLQCNRNYIDVRLLIYRTEDGDLVGFFTNMDAEPEQIAELYSWRWGIETGYRIKKEFRARTCSTSFAVRLFLILLSVLLYNFWVSVNVENWLLNEKALTARKVRIIFRIVIEQDIG